MPNSKAESILRLIIAIRDAEIARGPEEMDVEIIDACIRIIVGNLDVSEEQKECAWERLMERIHEEENGGKYWE